MKAKLTTVTLPGIPLPIRCLVLTCEKFTAYRKNGREIFRIWHVNPRLN